MIPFVMGRDYANFKSVFYAMNYLYPGIDFIKLNLMSKLEFRQVERLYKQVIQIDADLK